MTHPLDLKAARAVAPGTPTLSRGDEDPSHYKPGPVSELQRLLNQIMKAGLNECGVFSWGTHFAVKEFQHSRNLEANGVVDSATWAALLVAAEKGQV